MTESESVKPRPNWIWKAAQALIAARNALDLDRGYGQGRLPELSERRMTEIIQQEFESAQPGVEAQQWSEDDDTALMQICDHHGLVEFCDDGDYPTYPQPSLMAAMRDAFKLGQARASLPSPVAERTIEGYDTATIRRVCERLCERAGIPYTTCLEEIIDKAKASSPVATGQSTKQCGSTFDGWVCSLDSGHIGRHEAKFRLGTCKTWANLDPVDPAASVATGQPAKRMMNDPYCPGAAPHEFSPDCRQYRCTDAKPAVPVAPQPPERKYEAQETMIFRTAGYSVREQLTVSPRRAVLKVNPQSGARCGRISDGVVFQHDYEGAWVLSFADLECIYLRAKQLKLEAGEPA